MSNRSWMDSFWPFACGLAVGVALVEMFDPATVRRRKRIGDQISSAAHTVADLGTVTQMKAQDAQNRAAGMAAETRSRMAADAPSDRVLVDRVRAEIGHAVVHAGAVEVGAHDGVVILRGPVLSDEVDDLLRAARSVPGVRRIDSRLEIHETPGRTPALQGNGRR